MFLFDTDIITNIFKKKPYPSLVNKLASLPQSHQFISTITVSEIVYGAMKSGRADYHLKNLEEILIPAVNIVAFDLKASYICGNLRARLEKQEKPQALADLEIAAIALAHDFTLVSGNQNHFARISELKLENWLA
ncbi:MAG: type II toxin-antitoxin system VapC family toxin [Desulfobacteraceae bacterium]|nr:type II toxin-antitoxin system VapC family toxin [Desulfobacteraceae bacterium]